MYPCSSDFHEAVRNGSDQKALLIFSDCVFTDLDLDVEQGIEFDDYFNTDEDISIGLANSNEISFSIFNDERTLNNYTFGEFLATMGALTSTTTYAKDENCRVVTSMATYIGTDDEPYLTRNGTAVAESPGFEPKSLLAYNGKIYVFGTDNQYAVYDDATGDEVTEENPVNGIMCAKSKRWNGKGMYYRESAASQSNSGKFLTIWEDGKKKIYEFVPLGYFTAERPKAPDTIQLDLTCYDRMQLFDKDMPSASTLGISYPTTIGNLLSKMCEHLGVTCATSSFTNKSAQISAEPEDFQSATMRDVLKWIAEAAGCNARFNRDGELELAWLRSTNQSYTAYGYSEFNPAWYRTKTVSKLVNRDSATGEDHTRGSGNEGYLIQDNPLLKGVS